MEYAPERGNAYRISKFKLHGKRPFEERGADRRMQLKGCHKQRERESA
jgi:hypothetical protein